MPDWDWMGFFQACEGVATATSNQCLLVLHHYEQLKLLSRHTDPNPGRAARNNPKILTEGFGTV